MTTPEKTAHLESGLTIEEYKKSLKDYTKPELREACVDLMSLRIKHSVDNACEKIVADMSEKLIHELIQQNNDLAKSKEETDEAYNSLMEDIRNKDDHIESLILENERQTVSNGKMATQRGLAEHDYNLLKKDYTNLFAMTVVSWVTTVGTLVALVVTNL